MRDVRIIIPAHNEADRLEETVVALGRHFGERATLLVVANGCTDDTADVVRRLSRQYATLELLEFGHRIGKGGAVRAGLTLGREPYVAFVDADGSTAPDQLDLLLQRCSELRLSGAIGSRWLPGSRIARRQPFRRRLASRAFNTVTRVLFGLPYTDTQCGAKVFERGAIDNVLHKLEIANFAFDVDLLLALKKLGKPVAEIPIYWNDVAEYSKVMLVRSGSAMLWALLRLLIRDSIFGSVPFVEALGRSQTIPVRCGLDILFIVRPARAERRELGRLVSVIRERGHVARVVELRGLRSLTAFVVWYVRYGHRLCDVIVHDLGRFGGRILDASAKHKYVLADITGRAVVSDRFGEHFVDDVMTAMDSALYFRRDGDGWSFASQRLEATSAERP